MTNEVSIRIHLEKLEKLNNLMISISFIIYKSAIVNTKYLHCYFLNKNHNLLDHMELPCVAPALVLWMSHDPLDLSLHTKIRMIVQSYSDDTQKRICRWVLKCKFYNFLKRIHKILVKFYGILAKFHKPLAESINIW